MYHMRYELNFYALFRRNSVTNEHCLGAFKTRGKNRFFLSSLNIVSLTRINFIVFVPSPVKKPVLSQRSPHLEDRSYDDVLPCHELMMGEQW
jgi:hypothetical protein